MSTYSVYCALTPPKKIFNVFRFDLTVMVDWALKTSYLSVFLSSSLHYYYYYTEWVWIFTALGIHCDFQSAARAQ